MDHINFKMYDEEEKDDQNPTFQAINIQRQNIEAIIERMVQKLELALCMDDLLAELDKSKEPKIINRRTLEHLQSIAGKQRLLPSKLKISSSLHQSSSHTFHSIQLINETLIPILHHKHETREIVKAKLESKPEFLRIFIKDMHSLKLYIKEMVSLTETEESKQRKNIAQTWLRNEKFKVNLKDLQNTYNMKTRDLLELVNDKMTDKERYVTYIKELNEKSLYDWESIILKTENDMRQQQRQSLETREKLSQEAQTVTKDYQTLLSNNLDQEKQWRKKRYKVETILAQLLAKYDADIGELQKDLEEVQDAYNDLKTNYENLQRDFEVQSTLHTELMQEKADEEQRIFDAKLLQIIINRSVRIIQRWWRKIYWKRHKKKKGKGKGKGKKK